MTLLEPPKDYSKLARQGKVSILILIGILVVLGVYSTIQRRSLERNKMIGNAIIYEISNPPKGSYSANFGFNHKGNIYKSSYTIPELRFSSDKFKLIGKWVPVIYDSSNPDNNCLLLTKDDFIDYNINYPDSLDWFHQLQY